MLSVCADEAMSIGYSTHVGKLVRMWDPVTGRRHASCTSLRHQPTCSTVLLTNKWLVVGDSQGGVHMFDPEEFEQPICSCNPIKLAHARWPPNGALEPDQLRERETKPIGSIDAVYPSFGFSANLIAVTSGRTYVLLSFNERLIFDERPFSEREPGSERDRPTIHTGEYSAVVHAEYEFTGLTNETFGLSLAAIGAKEMLRVFNEQK